jgi:hypothetical protein
MVALPRTITKRLHRTSCPACGVELELELVGVIDAVAWMESLPIEAIDYIHNEHAQADETVALGREPLDAS